MMVFLVIYVVWMEDGKIVEVINLLEFLMGGKVVEVWELIVKVVILVLKDYVGIIMEFC